jgi:hypothetical protein
MIAETLFCAELLRPIRTQKFRDHAAGQPGSMADQATGRPGDWATGRPDQRWLSGVGL